MPFDPSLAEFRFGYGLSPEIAAPASVAAMLDRLAGPDHMAEAYPVARYDLVLKRLERLRQARIARRKSPGEEADRKVTQVRDQIMKRTRSGQRIWLGRTLSRRCRTEDAFRERLVAFWADHFTARGKSVIGKWASSPYVEGAIRPHVTGRFADLLKSAIKAPLMLEYLDQRNSRGPGSRIARRTARDDGMNENLARELLELHTLGVNAQYGQGDVRQLAELLTGLTFSPRRGTFFRKDFAEPGAEIVLGRRYGGGTPDMRDIDALLEDLAVHPDTARHIARKLAVHFISDTPSDSLVAALAEVFLRSAGGLMDVYEVLLSHPDAWSPEPGNVRPPLDWVSSAVRALAVPPERLTLRHNGPFLNKLIRALPLMGQRYEAADGPDGWPEEDAFWVTPQGMAARLQWALGAPGQLLPQLPDPRAFVETALGPRRNERLTFIAAAAESRADGIGLILAAPEFQRS